MYFWVIRSLKVVLQADYQLSDIDVILRLTVSYGKSEITGFGGNTPQKGSNLRLPANPDPDRTLKRPISLQFL